jgi:hypothetical protein
MSAGNAAKLPFEGNPKPPADVVMAVYDELPPIVRRAVQDSVFDWDVTAILSALRDGRATPDEVVEHIRKFEAEHVRR